MKDNNKSKISFASFFGWPLILLAVILLSEILMLILNNEHGMAALPYMVLLALLCLVFYFLGRKRIIPGMTAFADEYDTTRQRLLESLTVPAALSTTDGKIIWRNRAFKDAVSNEELGSGNLISLFPDLTKEMLTPADDIAVVHSSIGEKRYKLTISWENLVGKTASKNPMIPVEASDRMVVVCLTDETELLEYRQLYNDNRACQGIITLDNYDEALASVDEVRRSLLTALVDRKLSNYFSSMNGIIKKFEVDKYLLFIKDMDMAYVIEDRFSVLDDVKTINIGNSLNFTVSIGIGMRGKSYDDNYDSARKAMELALGRGGDQAVIISDGQIEYFGGKSTAAAKNTRVKARVKAQAFREILDSKDQVIVMGHKTADVDALGASVGIWRTATALGKKAYIVNGNTDASVMPFKKRLTESGHYPEDFLISGEKALALVDPATLLVVVDVNRPSYSEEPRLIEKCSSVMVIDHHRMGSETIENPVLSYVEPYASSASEMVSELIQYIDESITFEPAEADVLYGGIVLDTQNFVVQAGVRTFEAAAFLRRKGADVVRVRKMFRENITDYRAKAQTVDKAQIYKDCFAISVCDPEGTGSPTVIGAQAANELLEIDNVKAAVVLTPYNGKTFLSARSIDEINVQLLMERLGGGGHKAVAGAQLQGMDVEDALAKVRAAIDDMIEKGEID
ncbi:MAG: DHH family phosphoesterase [Lachnospiraceae bacterium]|nr:DHH family phosphoesterase [Lachnospiraceae bacterium]